MSNLFPLVVSDACVSARGKRLVGPVDLRLDAPGAVIVIGPNGAGKTTFLKMLHGVVRKSSGSVTWACPKPQAQAAQAFVFQTPVMLRRSVMENLAYPLRLDGVKKPQAQNEARRWADRIGLLDALNRPAPRLSGGERQKLALARALIRKPDLLFLDEPCASLDGRATREIEALLQQARGGGTALIMATHDMGQAKRLASDVIFLLGGRIHEMAPAARFFDGPKTPEARAFLAGDIVE